MLCLIKVIKSGNSCIRLYIFKYIPTRQTLNLRIFVFLPCVILFLCFSVLLALRLPRLGKRELILVLFVRLFDLCSLGFCRFPFTLGVWEGLRFVIVALSGLFSYLCFSFHIESKTPYTQEQK